MDGSRTTRRMHRRRAIIGFGSLAAVVSAMLVLSGLSWLNGGPLIDAVQAQPSNDCTILGTPGRDIKAGNRSRDVICLRGNSDYGHGRAGNDIVRGGSANDTLIGGRGNDRIFGKKGNDQLFAVDDRPGDVLRGGKGRDRCYADVGDLVKGCETTHRGATIQTSTSLQQSFGGVMELAEELIAEGPVPPGPVPTGPVPPGPTRPQCTPPPASPPPHC